jgi:hypothetical protein
MTTRSLSSARSTRAARSTLARYPTPSTSGAASYQIAQAAALAAAAYIGTRNTGAINQHFRAQDESNFYPICGRFNATERAIRKVRREFAECGMRCEGWEYALAIDVALDQIISQES